MTAATAARLAAPPVTKPDIETPKGTTTRRLTWAETVPFPGNPIYAGRLKAMRDEWGGYVPQLSGAVLLFHNGGAFPDLPEDALLVGDGNHRRTLAEEDGKLDGDIIAIIHKGLTRREMYRVRRGLNDRRTVKPAENFLGLVGEGRDAQKDVLRIVEACGFEVGHERRDATLSCTNEMEWIYGKSPAALTRALETYVAVWGHAFLDNQAATIKGLGAFWAMYPEASPERLAHNLKDNGITPAALYSAARNHRETLTFVKSIFDGVRYELAVTYNRGRKTGRLPLAD